MNKTWDGPTPKILSGSIGPLWNMGFAEGYRAAMNSPEVKAMYEALRNMATELDDNGIARWNALAAYEAGLKETE